METRHRTSTEEKTEAAALILQGITGNITVQAGSVSVVGKQEYHIKGDVFAIDEKDNQTLKWFFEYKKKFQLKGDFGALERVASFKCKDSSFRGATGDILKRFPQKLREISVERLQVLQTFSNQNKLISWLLKSKMKDIAQVKSMGDHAIPSAKKIEKDRWLCLLSAVQGFSPLLFQLHSVKNLDALLIRCEEVWANVEGDNKIVEKWNKAGHLLPWFSLNTSVHRSDEKLSVQLVQDINERGVYTLRKPSDEQPTLHNVISFSLRRPRRQGENQTRKDPEICDFQGLQDLQLKLSLLAGKADEDQEDIFRFFDIFSAVKTLGESFINLLEAGFILFNNWTAEILSHRSETFLCQIEYKLELTIRFTECSIPLSEQASPALLNKLSQALRQVHQEWNQYTSSKRLQHYHLNEYNMQQITYLCHELANSSFPPDQVVALLSKDPKRLSPAVLQDALDQAIRIVDPQETQDEGEEYLREDGAMSKLQKKRRTIRQLVNREHLPEDLAKAAVQAVGHYCTIEDCNNWAVLNGPDKYLVEKYLQEFEKENAFAHETNDEEELVDVFHNRAVNSLTEIIDEILKEVTQCVDSVVEAVQTICLCYYKRISVHTVKDYLSIDHLGKLLTNLYAGTEVKPKVNRTMPDLLQQGKPNLIVCAEDKTLQILLSLYMNNPAEPLPTTSEVLLCSEKTTIDDVERFMRRAMCKCNHNGKPLFCMGYSEKLNFNVSRALENFFEYMRHGGGYIDQAYQLVFISSSRQHYTTECFDKYQAQRWPSYSSVEISQYLIEHLALSEVKADGKFGSSLVRVVVSNRSGVGKSLFIKNLSAGLDIEWYQKSKLEHMDAVVKLLSRDEDITQLPRRVMPRQLKPGKPNLIHCSEGEILPLLMTLYMHNPENPRPTSSEILLCCRQTTQQEVERFVRRAMCKLDKENSIFTIAFGERLTPSAVSQIKILSETLGSNIHSRSDYQLVILSSNLSQFSWCEKFELGEGSNLSDCRNMSAYLSGSDSQGSTDIMVQKIEHGHKDGSDKINAVFSSESTQAWYKTTVRLLEKAVDTNHVLDQLYREEHLRNEDNHFIHIDLTPAVEDGTERFMFNLLILGTIQDDSGRRVWNRQKQHLYIIEMTESELNQDQVAKSNILGMLPRTYCKSPKESLKKLRMICWKVKKALKSHLPYFSRAESPELQALQNYINCSSKFSLENFWYKEEKCKERNALSEILYLAGIPSSIIPSIRQGITEELRKQLVKIYDEEKLASMVLMNHSQFISTNFQRPYQYLKYCRGKEEADPLTRKDLNLDDFQYSQPAGTPEDCIHTILQTGALGMNPSWAQLRHFTTFMNMQLQNCEESQFCQKISIEQNGVSGWQDRELRGLKAFAVKFVIRMSQDFATPSLDIADQSSKDADTEAIATHQVRSRWEEKCHPYVFFNEDRSTMTFINVALNSRGDLLDEDDNILERNIASTSLMDGLRAQGIKFGFKFHLLSRKEKLEHLRTVMGLAHSEEDPDPTYELTTDNVLKILAIYMRMRCNIPVIIMGETGCGKTRLVEFMSKLRSQGASDVLNMVALKIHAGLTMKAIYAVMEKANQLAAENATRKISTVLFYDEANTTNDIYVIKEAVCDGTFNGKSFHGSHLQIVAACNPYKVLPEKAIKILEKSGLGYRVSESETPKTLGIPMRRLVYKVVPLPPGVQPFVLDFGELSTKAEGKYIRQMTVHLQSSLKLSKDEKVLIDFVFCACQSYMKTEIKDECRYVSFRDIERCMKLYAFFHGQREFLFPKIQDLLNDEYGEQGTRPPSVSSTLRCLIQTIGVCYHASLHERKRFREHIAAFPPLRVIKMTEHDMAKELEACQNVFLNSTKMEKDITPNQALRENVYLFTICAQLGIPLFLVGKPGSSKSLARTIVATNMRGKNSHNDLYQRLKQIQMVAYQCSALTDATGIESIFQQCLEIQKNKKLEEFAAVAVLDEIGLAEDSPNMPLKILHLLLEYGSITTGTLAETSPEKKVGFVGISNWALDPDKMNRGIFVTRSKPSKADLLETAKGIMEMEIRMKETEILLRLTETYLTIYNNQIETLSKEYFGLRDYYALIKMVNSGSASKGMCDIQDVAHAVQRNFGGGRHSYFKNFSRAVQSQFLGETAKEAFVQNIIRQNLEEQDTRFLLLVTAEQAPVCLIEHALKDFSKKVQVIYGSSFPGDNNFKEICKNINRIRVCMETGGIVLLLDMAETHESLYDVLNQHYTTYEGERYVDIALDGNRIPCRIANDFRLIIAEKKEVVYLEYPIPLINRLEKHHLILNNLLTDSQQKLSLILTRWAKTFSDGPFAEKDAFIGYHADTIGSLVLSQGSDGSLETCKNTLLQTASADAILRLTKNPEKDTLLQRYIEEQVHDSLVNLLQHRIKNYAARVSFMEIVSFSNILTERDGKKIRKSLKLQPNAMMLLSLQQFDTKQEYQASLDIFFSDSKELSRKDVKVLLIQCPQAEKHGSLLACAKYCVTDRLKDATSQGTIIIAFLLSTQRQYGNVTHQLVLQHDATTEIIYVDDLRPKYTPVSQYYNKSLTEILQLGKAKLEASREVGDNTINFMELLKDSIYQAMVKIRRDDRTDYRNLACIQLLTRLCSKGEGPGHEFQLILLQKMIDIYSDREKKLGRQWLSWIVWEASSAEHLKEGGTFGNTLCLCLKGHLVHLLSFIISKIDENNNLDFFLTENVCFWKQELWLMLFADHKMEWPCRKGLGEFWVQILPHLPHDYTPQFPFSSVLNRAFEIRWNSVQNEQKAVKVFFNQFRETSQYKILQSLCTDDNMDDAVKSYAADVIHCLFDYSKLGEVGREWLTKILLAIADTKKEKLMQKEIYQNGDDITIVYYSYKQHFKHLSMLHDIFRVCPDLLLQVNEWIDEQAKERELIIHELAMKSMLDWIKAYDIKDKNSSVDWMVLASKCKGIFHSCKDLIQMEKHKKEIATKWEPISLRDFILLHLLPSAGSDSFSNYIEVVVRHAKRLLNPLKIYGFRNKDFLRMILNVLRRSYEDIRLRLLIRWGDPTCGMCRRALKNPVKLPCGHFVCSACIDRILAAAEMRLQCPRCLTQVRNDIDTSTASLSEHQEGEAADFKANCTSFFLQYLKKFCFSNRDSEMEEQATLFLYELVAAVSKNGGKMELETFAIDLNIATRSNIFQLLLDNYPDLVKMEIDRLLSSRYLSYKQLQELIIIILHGYETNLHEPQEGQILKKNWRSLKNKTGGVNLEALRVTAAIRHTLLEQLPDIRAGTELNPNQLAVIEMCAFDDTGTLGTFMVKAGCQLFGLEWFNFVSNHERLKDLVPRYLRDAANDKTVDHWLILGPKYAEIREKIHKISYDNYRQQLQMWITENQEMQDKLPIILAIAWHGKANHVYALRQRLGDVNPLLRIFNLLNKEIPTFTRNQSDLLNQLIILTGCVLMCQPAMMESYYHLATNPAGVSELFWPAMPESLFFSIRDILATEKRIATYACPNGHPYVIGERTRPWIEAECPECGEGRLHQAAEGNQRIEQSEASQAGYQLLADIKGKDDPCDRMSKQGVAVAHFITHCCMLIALEQDPVTIYRFFGVNGGDKEVAKNNLYAKLQENIADLSQALGRNYDDAVIVLHSCIVSLIANGFKVDHQNADSNASTDNEPTWETMRGRRNWEKRFRGRYLLPVFKNLDKVLNDARNQINAVEKLHDMLLYKTVHEIEIDEERTEITWKHPNLWKIIMHSKAAHLLQSVRDSQAKGRVLNVILESPDLHLLQHLENVLKLQKALITKYQNQIDMKQVDEITFDMYMDGGEGHRNRKLIKDYIYLWNSIYEVFRQETNKKVWPFLQELSLSSPISMALPSARGRGRCAKMLTEYLIDIHNNFLQKCAEAMNSIAGPGVDVQQLLQANFICIDKQNDLLPLISMHTAYNTSTDDSGRHHHIAYNVEALEKQVRENFVVYKSSINKKSLPCITYPQDIGIGSDWGRIMENIKQEPLTNKIVQELDALVTNQDVTPADVCDGVRTVTHAISFLAKIKTEKTKTLHTYLEESLLLTPNHMAMIPRSALVVHTLALYQRLMWHKAVNFVEQGLDPYQEALSKVDQEKISTPDILQRLKDAFDHMDMDLFQQRLNEIIIQAPDHSPGWSLKDEIFPYLEFLDGDDQEWFERIPSEVCFKHISHLFQLAVKGINTPNTDERPAQ